MSGKPGERARETGDFHCKGCSKVVHVTKGDKLPACNCGSNEYDERTNEPGNKSSRSHHSHSSH